MRCPLGFAVAAVRKKCGTLDEFGCRAPKNNEFIKARDSQNEVSMKGVSEPHQPITRPLYYPKALYEYGRYN